ncbi:HtaA domain-containing protein [Leucobacter chromiireducens]|uniref:HtaA domain-containing protein n=1 Tax=Leucobacter chromiireducens TaxID=283877 RepID=UPI003F7E3E95
MVTALVAGAAFLGTSAASAEPTDPVASEAAATQVVAAPTISRAAVDGIELSVAATGIAVPADKQGVYAGLVPAGTSAVLGTGAFLPTAAIRGGAGTFKYTIPAASLDRNQSYDAILWWAHGNPDDDAIVARVPVEIAAEQWDAVFPPVVPAVQTTTTLSFSAPTVEEGTSVTLTAQVSPAAAGDVAFSEGATQLGVSAVADGIATLTTSTLSVGVHNITAAFSPTDSAAFVASSSAAMTLEVVEVQQPEGATGSAVVSAASETGLTVQAKVAGVDPASQPAGVHVGVVLRGTADGATQSSFLGGTQSVNVIPVSGEFESSVTVPVAQLDRSKEYEVVVWPRRSNPTAANIVKVLPFDVSAAEWDKVFPKQVTGSAVVSAASETGLTVQAKVAGVDPASQPAGVHVGVVLRGTADGATQSSFLGGTQSVNVIPASGEFESSVTVPVAQLDRSKEYEVVVWPRRSNPTAANIVKVLPFDVSAAEWDKVFPKQVTGSAVVSAASETGLTVQAKVAGVDPASQPAGVHVGVVLRGTADGATQSSFLGGTQSVNVIPASGEFESSVTVPVAQLDRSKEYEVVVWPRRSNPTAANIVKVLPFDVSAAEWDKVFPKAAASVKPKVSAASETGLTVTTELANIESKTGAYVAVIEAGKLSEVSESNMGLAMEWVRPASFTGGAATSTLEVPAAKLDRSKSYEVVAWTGHSMPSAETTYGVSELKVSAAEWDKVFPKQVTGSAVVSAASETGLTVQAKVAGVDPASQPAGVHVGVVLRGTADGATQSSFLGGTQSVNVIPASGEFESSVTVPVAQLDRSKEYEVVVWPRRSNPTAANIVKVLPFDVSAAEWDKVFPKAAASVKPKVSAASETGLTVTTELANIESKTGAYVAVIEAGKLSEVSESNMGLAMEWVRPASFTGGAATSTLEVPAAKLDRSKSYEVVAWTGHSMPSAETTYGVSELKVSAAEWDKVFPKAAASVKPKVSAASETGLTVTTELANIESKTGAYVAVIEAGKLSEVSESNMGLAMEWVRPASFTGGAATSTLEVPAAKLDRSKNYEVVAWTGHSMPSAETTYGVAALDVSLAQWNQVFPTGGAKVQAGVSHAGADGISVTATISGIALDSLDAGVYASLIERGTEGLITPENMGAGYAFVKRDAIRDGKTTVVLDAGATKLDRTKSYEVIVWRAHAMPTPDRMVGRDTVDITEAQWNEVFGVDFTAGGTAGVTGAGAGKLEVTAKLRGFDPARFSSGVNVAVIVAGTSEKPKPIGTVRVTDIPKNGAFDAKVVATGSSLDRTRTYEVLVWDGKSAGGSANVLTLPVDVTKANWDAVFPPKVETMDGSFEWGVRKEFRDYVTGSIAKGKITVSNPASGSSVYKFPQIAGGTWDAKKQTGSVKFAGNVNFTGHDGVLNLNLANPELHVLSASKAELRAVHKGKLLTIATLDLSKGKKSAPGGNAVRFTGVPVQLTTAGAAEYFDSYLDTTAVMDSASFTIGAAANVKPVKPPVSPVVKPKPKPNVPVAPVAPGAGGQQAGSLTWGVSSGFAAYTTGRIAKGSISTSGVGGGAGGYVFPQSSSSWNATTQTGTVQYSGVVTFTGHKGLMSESFANPVITVTGPSSGTLTAGGRSFGLNLAAGSKSVGQNGEVTWSGVPLSGGIAGGGGGGGGAFGADPISFTVGAVSGASFGSTTVDAKSTKRTAADAPPVTTGIRILTDAKKLVPGGEIEFEAAGFEPGERDVLVVLYSEPTVLDDAAGADANGVVRWIGSLPKDLPVGEHTITLQGSKDAGAVFTVVKAEKKAKAPAKQESADEITIEAEAATPVAAGVVPSEGTPVWIWWTGALALLVVAGAMGGLVVAQRRKATAGAENDA